MSKNTKTALCILAAVIAVFIPTYIALISHAVIDSREKAYTGKETSMTVTDETNSTVFAGVAGSSLNSDMLNQLAELLRSGQKQKKPPVISGADIYTITLRMPDQIAKYTLYVVAADDGASYLSDADSGVLYAISPAKTERFCQAFAPAAD